MSTEPLLLVTELTISVPPPHKGGPTHFDCRHGSPHQGVCALKASEKQSLLRFSSYHFCKKVVSLPKIQCSCDFCSHSQGHLFWGHVHPTGPGPVPKAFASHQGEGCGSQSHSAALRGMSSTVSPWPNMFTTKRVPISIPGPT